MVGLKTGKVRRYSRRQKKAPKKTAVKKTVSRMLVARGLNKPELKNWITAFNPGQIALSPASTGVQLDPQRQGDNDIIYNGYIYPTVANQGGNVIGNKITAKYMNCQFQFYNNDTGSHLIRVLIVCDNQPQNSQALVPYSAQKVGTNANMWLSSSTTSLYIPQSTRFNVLLDKTLVLSGEDNEKNIQMIKRKINLNNAHIQYTQSATDTEVLISDNRRYILYLIPDTEEFVYGTYQIDFGFTDV